MEIRDKVDSHQESAEFSMILACKMACKIGALAIFIADQGDIVYTPKQTWHRARIAGTEVAGRLATKGYQDPLHDYETMEELRGD
jgi:mannose-6-phosphate isomerase-like protein (cupin superfamily)